MITYGTLFAEYEKGKPLRGSNGELFAYTESRTSGHSFSKVGSSFWINYGFYMAENNKKKPCRIGIVTPENHFIYTKIQQSQGDHYWLNQHLFGGMLLPRACFSSRHGGAVCWGPNSLYPLWHNIRIDLANKLPVDDYEIFTKQLNRTVAARVRKEYKASTGEAALFLQSMNDGTFNSFSEFARDVYLSEGGSPLYWWETNETEYDFQQDTPNWFARRAVQLMNTSPLYSFVFQMLAALPGTLHIIKRAGGNIRQQMFLHTKAPRDLMSLYDRVVTQFSKRQLYLAHGNECFQHVRVPIPHKGAPYRKSTWGITVSVDGKAVKQF